MSIERAYITCPVSHTQEQLRLLPQISSLVASKGIEPFVFIVGGSPSEIFDRDFERLKASTLVIAEASEPSLGVGIEVGMSYCLGLERILLVQKGNFVTKLAQGMPKTTIIEYETAEDLNHKLGEELDRFLRAKSG